jgi:hypothetical protein
VSPVELTDGIEGGGGAESYYRKKSWPSLKHSILSGLTSCEDMSTSNNIKIVHNAQYVTLCGIKVVCTFFLFVAVEIILKPSLFIKRPGSDQQIGI